jgi:hypothetical protein
MSTNITRITKIKVESFNYKSNKDQMFFMKGTNVVKLYGTRYLGRKNKKYDIEMICTFKDGFTCDGASSPAFAKYIDLPKIKKDNNEYNAGAFIHDALYMHTGDFDDVSFSREECDDILRRIWVLSGLDPLLARIAYNAVRALAGSKQHWGNDDNDTKHLFDVKFIYKKERK